MYSAALTFTMLKNIITLFIQCFFFFFFSPELLRGTALTMGTEIAFVVVWVLEFVG